MKKKDPKARKKRKLKKRYWLLAELAAALLILALFLYTPSGYSPLRIAHDEQVSIYLTHDLLPQLYNNVQLGRPFDLIVTQKGINDVVARSDWPKFSDGATLSAPAVHFVPGRIVLMGTVTLKGIEFVVTIALAPSFNEDGLLNLQVAKVKVGAMNITPLARTVAKRMYEQHVEAMPVDKEDIGVQIAASLLNDEPFDPIIDIQDLPDNGGIKARIVKATIEHKKLTLRLVPL